MSTPLTKRRAAMRLVAQAITLIALLVGAALTTPVANASQGEQCENRTSYQSLKIDKRLAFDDHLDYGASWHWCWDGTNVTKFIVDSTWGELEGVTVDIRPRHPLRFGPSYPISLTGSRG